MTVHPIVPYARTAYAQGWAASGGPLTDRVIAGSIAAIELAIEHADDPHVIEATLQLGQLEGMWAKIFDRRTALYNEQVTKVGRYWKSFASDVDVASMVTAIRNQIGTSQESVSATTVAAVAALILALLFALAMGVKWWNLRKQIAAGLSAGEAEGTADALALVADGLGYANFNFDLAATDALDILDQEELDASVDEWSTLLLNGISSELARRLSTMAASGASYDDMMVAAQSILMDAQGRGLVSVVDGYVHSAITRGIMGLYRTYGVANAWWITAGDNTVCPVCDENEANSPYPVMDCPQPPEHVNCRCSLYTEDSLPGDLISPYV